MAQEYERRNKQSSDITEGYLTAISDFLVSGYYLDLKRQSYCAIGRMKEYFEQYTEEDGRNLIDDYIRECIHRDDQALITEVSRIDYIREHLKKEKNYSVEARDHSTGTERWYRFTVMRGADADHAAISFTDVTEQVMQRQELERLSAKLEEQNKQLEEKQAQLEESAFEREAQLKKITVLNNELESNQAELRQALTSSGEAAAMLNSVHEILGSASWKIEYDETGKKETKADFTDEFRRLFGYENKEDFPDSLDFMISRVHPDDKDRMLKDVYGIVKNSHNADVNIATWYRAYRKDGTLRWYRVQGIVKRREDGSALLTYGVTMDVTDLEKSEIAQKETLEAFESVHDVLGSANYLRRDDSGHVGYHQIAFANADTQDGKKQFVYGFRDIDTIVKEEQKQKEELKEQRDILEKRYDAIQSLSKVYYASYYVDMDHDDFYELLSSDDIKNKYAEFGPRGKAQSSINWACENSIAPEYREAARAFTDYSTLSERMRDTEVIN